MDNQMENHIGGMSSYDDWQNQTKLTKFLASRLEKRRISLFLGAGVSDAFNLPQWSSLIDRMYAAEGEVRPKGGNDTRDAESLAAKQKYRDDPLLFANAVRAALYKEFSMNASQEAHNPMLSALGALVMASVRGAAASVVTFNFDDILETYLRWRGFVVESVAKLPAWNGSADVSVLHPHGLLPIDSKSPVASTIVLTQIDYDRVVGDAKNFWRQRLTDILRSTTPIFIGLSGNDQNLTSMLTEVASAHPSKATDYFWGIRLTALGDNNSTIWETRRIRSFECKDFQAIPPMLMDICRGAADIRTAT